MSLDGILNGRSYMFQLTSTDTRYILDDLSGANGHSVSRVQLQEVD